MVFGTSKGGDNMEANVKMFEVNFKQDSDYVGVKIGERRRALDGTWVIVTNIVSVIIEDGKVHVKGYGIPYSY
jgi:hypothetical protein